MIGGRWESGFNEGRSEGRSEAVNAIAAVLNLRDETTRLLAEWVERRAEAEDRRLEDRWGW